ncbi:MAG: Signal transduction response regulator [Promethearchaeota archaeon]|nr:MAG: Signal transduction response regulator [Candidatus Lokiarchaeota archaeon]
MTVISQRVEYTEEEVNEIVKQYQDGEVTEEIKQLMERYETETGKYAVWRSIVTEGFRKWLRGEKIYDRNKERVSLYVSEETKELWQQFIDKNNISTFSKLIRESVKKFMEDHKNSSDLRDLSKIDPKTISQISHTLKEPLTTIKGFSQLLLQNSNDLNKEIKDTIQNIFDQSIMLENRIVKFLDNIKLKSSDYDIMLIEDDLATIRLITSYFQNKGYTVNGIVSGAKALEELKDITPKIILLDIILPDISGYEICKLIKNDKDLSEIPVYLLTAITSSEVRERIEEIRADGYILKPFDFSDFSPIFKYL